MENVEELNNKVRFLYKKYFEEDMPVITGEKEQLIKNLKFQFIAVSEEDFLNCAMRANEVKKK